MKKLNVGLVGAGWMGKMHSYCYKAYRQFFGSETLEPFLHTICEINDDLSNKAKKDFGYEYCTSNWKELIDNPEIDIINITSPNHLHYEVAKKAIEAGKHVYCEKPLTNSYKTALELAELAEKKGVKTLVGFNYIQNPAQLHARDIVKDGKLGDIHHFRGEMIADYMADPNIGHSWRNEISKAGSGQIGDTSSHVFSLFKHLTNKKILEVFCHRNIYIKKRPQTDFGGDFAKKTTINKEAVLIENETDDKAITLFKFENNGIGIVESSRVSTGNKNDLKYTLTGNQGALRFSMKRNNEIQFYNNNEEESLKGFKKIEMGPFNDEFAKFHPVAGIGLGYQDYKLLECKQIIEAIALNGEAYPNFRWGAEIQLLVDAAIKSSKENRWIKIKELI